MQHNIQCDMCGKSSDLFKTNIEGTILNVCLICSKHGKVLRKVILEQDIKARKPAESKKEAEIIEMIVEDFAKLVRDKREKLGLKQEELAKKVAEKESTIHHIETGHFKPGIELAKKLERLLNLKLVEAVEDIPLKTERSSGKLGTITIGDIIKVKKK